MASELPRISIHVPVETMARFKALQDRLGMKPVQLLMHLIDQEHAGVDRYVQTQLGHQSMLALALSTAVLRKQLAPEEIANVRSLASEAASLLFGPVPSRPPEFQAGNSDDPRVQALHDLLLKG